MQSVAGFASLHCGDHAAGRADGAVHDRHPVAQIAFWVNFGVTAVATLYFGWHYIADDVAGILIALVSFYIGGIASGQKFERGGLTLAPRRPPPRRCRRSLRD